MNSFFVNQYNFISCLWDSPRIHLFGYRRYITADIFTRACVYNFTCFLSHCARKSRCRPRVHARRRGGSWRQQAHRVYGLRSPRPLWTLSAREVAGNRRAAVVPTVVDGATVSVREPSAFRGLPKKGSCERADGTEHEIL